MSDVAIQFRVSLRSLEPNGKVAPPTYLESKKSIYAFEYKGNQKVGVLINSIAAEANLQEEALKEVAEELGLPIFEIEDIESFHVHGLTLFDLPHRIFDATLRDCIEKATGKGFGASDIGKAVLSASTQRPEALYKYAPTSLIYGAWNSTGSGPGHKFPRTIVSEIRGTGISSGVKVGSRIDPYGITSNFEISNKKIETDGAFTYDVKVKGEGNEKESTNPASVNHGNIPPGINFETGGVYCEHIAHETTIALNALRRLNLSGQQLENLKNLAILGFYLRLRKGYFLRSGCDLAPAPGGQLHVTTTDFGGNSQTEAVDLTIENINTRIDALKEALKGQFSGYRGTWVPGKSLQTLVKKSHND